MLVRPLSLPLPPSPSLSFHHTNPTPTQQESFASQKSALIAETARNATSSDRFTSKTDGVEDSLKRSTYGLVQLQDFKEKREMLEELARKEAAGLGEVKYAS